MGFNEIKQLAFVYTISDTKIRSKIIRGEIVQICLVSVESFAYVIQVPRKAFYLEDHQKHQTDDGCQGT
jgi:hypothetical protein